MTVSEKSGGFYMTRNAVSANIASCQEVKNMPGPV